MTDPDQPLWEIYVFHEDIDEHGEGGVPDVTTVRPLGLLTSEEPLMLKAAAPNTIENLFGGLVPDLGLQ